MIAKDSAAKRKKDIISIELKEIIGKHERGLGVADLAKLYGRSSSTICTILKKEEIKKLDVAKGVTMITKQCPNLLEDVEKLLLVWINEKQLKGDSVSEGITCTKAKALYVDLVRMTPGTVKRSVDNVRKRMKDSGAPKLKRSGRRLLKILVPDGTNYHNCLL